MEQFIYQIVLTPEDEGGYSVEVPDLPGCFTCGDTVEEAVAMATDAAKTCVASLMTHGDLVPFPTIREVEGATLMVFFEVDSSYIVHGETVRLSKPRACSIPVFCCGATGVQDARGHGAHRKSHEG